MGAGLQHPCNGQPCPILRSSTLQRRISITNSSGSFSPKSQRSSAPRVTALYLRGFAPGRQKHSVASSHDVLSASALASSAGIQSDIKLCTIPVVQLSTPLSKPSTATHFSPHGHIQTLWLPHPLADYARGSERKLRRVEAVHDGRSPASPKG